jgi:hypothetical protein
MRTRQRWLALAAVGGFNVLCLGLATLISARLLAWPLSFGIPLFGQVLFFMAFCYLLARRTSLYPDHPSFVNTPPAAIIARMEQTRRRLLVADLVGGGIALGLGIVLIVVASLNPAQAQLLLQLVASVMLALGCALWAHSATLLPRQSAHEYARQAGTPAMARVLTVTNMRHTQHAPTYDRARLYGLDLEVIPPTGAPYQVSIQQLVRRHPTSMPSPGTIIPIRYIPEQPQVVVALLNPEDRPPK